MKDILRYMAPYPYQECKLWPNLISHVTCKLLDKLQPRCKKICSYTEVSLEKENMSTGRIGRMLMKCDTRTIKAERVTVNEEDSNYQRLENLISFTKVPKLQSPSSPESITKNSIDSSLTLGNLIRCVDGGEFYTLFFPSYLR